MESIEEPKLENAEQQSEDGDADQDTLQGSKSAPELQLLPLPPSNRPKSLNNLTAGMDCQYCYIFGCQLMTLTAISLMPWTSLLPY